MKYLKKFENHSQYESYIATDYAKPNVSYCATEGDVHYNPKTWADDYLTFVALEDGTFTFTPTGSNLISYSTDNGDTWTQGNSVSVNNSDKVLWKGTMTPSTSSPYGIGNFSSTAEFDVQGNAMSLLYGDNFKGQTDLTGKNYAFKNLFSGNIKVVNAENLSLPATTLANDCYSTMFYNSTSLTTAPELPATTLGRACYYSMFYGCTSLISAPELPATILTTYCYQYMFHGCTSLTTAPELPATTLVSNCYYAMFNGCTNLNYIKAMFTTAPSTTNTTGWVGGVAANGTFVKNSAAQWDVSGVNGIPEGWMVQTASE